ncbi:hypothetical protein AEAC466_17375 [Asticcacaulis sp. AC466]|uniref:hypothetical protein n=1 Tax=Asticcacaulis sp. AC466 TaxID=1282362 RepID=UPI0003C3B650|nr:hypothetical protein [Asticcacaulis sp. AC466]ESQ82394.1 hypothetical protein AEAC466_17375 [Asticcacaulis sp. AC466]
MSKVIMLGQRWIPLTDGVVVMVDPIGRLALREGAKAYTAVMDVASKDGPENVDARVAANMAYSIAIAKHTIRAWGYFSGEPGGVITPDQVDQGVFRDDAGHVLQPTPDAIEMLMADAVFLDAFDEIYVEPYVAARNEKNASSPLPTGSSAGVETNTAERASNSKAETAG